MHRKIDFKDLYHCCDLDALEFKTTADIKPSRGTIGQERAMRALDFGLSLDSKGFNIYILGESGTGKMTSIRDRIKELAEKQPVPPDWCYVFNFKDSDVPLAISLESGRGAEFKKDMDDMVAGLRAEIPKIFESKEYEKSRGKIMEDFQEQQKHMISSVESEAKDKGFSIRKTVSGLVMVPVSPQGEPLTEEAFESLDDSHKKKIEEHGRALQEKLDDVVRAVREVEKGIRARMDALEREAVLSAVDHYIDEIKKKFDGHIKINAYMDQVKEDILESLGDFKAQEETQPALPIMRLQKAEPNFVKYRVNVVVNNSGGKGAPCVFESNPTYYNLFGRIEHKFQYGVAITDFSMIKGGSLHRANGGYIVIDALDLLKNIFSYESLKRAIRNRELRIEDVWEQYRLVSTTSLKPEAIDLDVKVILTGNPNIYYMLYNVDEEYRELFKVKADFDSVMVRNNESMHKYAEFIASKCNEESMLHFDRTGVARIIEYGSRIAGHQDKLSSKFRVIADLIRESQHWARQSGREIVEGVHVDTAIAERIYRNNRIEERMRESVEEDVIIVETSGERVGQVNGLAVLSMGDYSFGKPSRITAKTYPGKAGIVNIERETKMSGKIHEKAIFIISSYLGSKYAIKKPLTLSASITFEQLYGMIEGDSATCAELYVLLSSLSGLPLRQNMAVTGSMDQNGDVQPIGGVNEKIEGFFDLCAARGLDGSHGVIIPSRNLKHLMLNRRVVDAVQDGKFSIYPIDRMEQGLEILTGQTAGEPQDDGTYPEGTINGRIMARLEELSAAHKPDKKKDNGKDDEDNGK